MRRFFLNTLLVAVSVLMLPACNKEKPTKAVITVVDEAGRPVAGATVRLYANPAFPPKEPTRLDKQGVTFSSGWVEFDYSEFYKQGQAGFAVLDITATKDGFSGTGIIKIEEERTNEETVVLKPA